MAKRFIDDNIWSDPWYQDLDPIVKLFWIYLFSMCDMIGIWEVNPKRAEFDIGKKLPWEEIKKSLFEKLIFTEKYWIIKTFIKQQYPNINTKPIAPLHIAVKNQIHKMCLNYDLNSLSIDYRNPIDSLQVIVEEIEEEKVGVKVIKKPSITDLPLAFPSDNFRGIWENWLQHRKEKRSPLTPTAHKMQTAMLAAMSEDQAIACINQSIKNGWAGLFELKGNLNGSTTGNNRSGDDGCNVRPGFGDQIDEDAIRRASARKFAKILGEPDPHPESERPWADVRV